MDNEEQSMYCILNKEKITTEKFQLNSCTDVEMNTRYHKKYISEEVSGE